MRGSKEDKGDRVQLGFKQLRSGLKTDAQAASMWHTFMATRTVGGL